MGLTCRIVTYCFIVMFFLTTSQGITRASDLIASALTSATAPQSLEAGLSSRSHRNLYGAVSLLAPLTEPSRDYLIKVAYGRTFGTCTELDYATLEVCKRGRPFVAGTRFGPAAAELQMSVLASRVFYKAGKVERIKRLNFEDGYEVGWLPKWRLSLRSAPLGMNPYFESGAGIGYVTETYRNSGSRWNWSLMAGFGLEQSMPGSLLFSLGFQWRHLSNGNMWGKGDELHNSNSGTDMIQSLAMVVRRF